MLRQTPPNQTRTDYEIRQPTRHQNGFVSARVDGEPREQSCVHNNAHEAPKCRLQEKFSRRLFGDLFGKRKITNVSVKQLRNGDYDRQIQSCFLRRRAAHILNLSIAACISTANCAKA